MEGVAWEKWAARLICVAFLGLAAVLGFRYLVPVVLPFLLAWLLSLAVRPLARRFACRTGISQRLCAVVLLVLILLAVLVFLYVAADRLIAELEELLDEVPAKNTDEVGKNRDIFSFLAEKVPFVARFSAYRESINRALSDAASGLVVTLSSALPDLIAAFFSSVPNLLFFILVTVISAFYFCTASREPLFVLKSYLPQAMQKRLPAWERSAKRVAARFLRAYLLLLALTFALLLAGFLILRQKYAFLLALAVALVDLLPILGVGTVLIPWSVVALWNRQYFVGVGLLVLYVIVLVVRQIAEPKLLGRSLGLHPLPALFATFAGWYLFGFFGMLLSPVAAVLLKALFDLSLKKEAHGRSGEA